MTSWILDTIEDLLDKHLSVSLDNQYGLISVGYIILFVYQVVLYLVDAIFAIFGSRNVQRADNIGLLLSMFVFSAFYILFFLAVEPEHKRCFSAGGILTSVHLVCSVSYYYYVYLSTDVNDSQQLLYYTNWFIPVTMFFMTVLLSISAFVMCKMSFLRSYKQMVQDLYETEEQDGKKAV